MRVAGGDGGVMGQNEGRYYDALKVIATARSPEWMRKFAAREYGLHDASEAIEMAYENLIEEARAAIKGRRRPAPRPRTRTESA